MMTPKTGGDPCRRMFVWSSKTNRTLHVWVTVLVRTLLLAFPQRCFYGVRKKLKSLNRLLSTENPFAFPERHVAIPVVSLSSRFSCSRCLRICPGRRRSDGRFHLDQSVMPSMPKHCMTLVRAVCTILPKIITVLTRCSSIVFELI